MWNTFGYNGQTQAEISTNLPTTSTTNFCNLDLNGSESVSSCSRESFLISSSTSQLSPASNYTFSTIGEEGYVSTRKENPSKKKFSCEDCGKEFSKLRNYRYHRSKHEGSDQFSCICSVCGKRFIDRGYLSSHMKIHRNAKEYKCGYCQKGFNQRVAYNMHLQIHTGFKPHHCETCGKSFSRRMQLKQHLRTHSGERPYLCNVCNKAFADRSNMLIHQKLHSGERPFVCPICFKRFSRNPDLKTHMNYHTGIKPFECSKCHDRFSQSSNMRTHWKKCSGIPKSILSPGLSSTAQYPRSSELLCNIQTNPFGYCFAPQEIPTIASGPSNQCFTSPPARRSDWVELNDSNQSQTLSSSGTMTGSLAPLSTPEDEVIASVLRSPSPMIKFLSSLLKDSDAESSLLTNPQPSTSPERKMSYQNIYELDSIINEVTSWNSVTSSPAATENGMYSVSSPYLHPQTEMHSIFQFSELTTPPSLPCIQAPQMTQLHLELPNTNLLPFQQFAQSPSSRNLN